MTYPLKPSDMPEVIYAWYSKDGDVKCYKHQQSPNDVKYTRADLVEKLVPDGMVLVKKSSMLEPDFESMGRHILDQAKRIKELEAKQPEPVGDDLKNYQTGKWYKAKTIDEMSAFYMSRLPLIRAAAKEHGYAIGLHGSTRRDFDLIAMQWSDKYSSKDELAAAIQKAACGFSHEKYDWEKKPSGRYATSLSIVWTEWYDMISAGCIDLSIIELETLSFCGDVKAAAETLQKSIDADRLAVPKLASKYDGALKTLIRAATAAKSCDLENLADFNKLEQKTGLTVENALRKLAANELQEWKACDKLVEVLDKMTKCRQGRGSDLYDTNEQRADHYWRLLTRVSDAAEKALAEHRAMEGK